MADSPEISFANAEISLSVRKGRVGGAACAGRVRATAVTIARRRIGSKAQRLKVMFVRSLLCAFEPFCAFEPSVSHPVKRRAPMQTASQRGETDQHPRFDRSV